MNPFLSTIPKEITIKLLCKFMYPIIISGKPGIYYCSVSYNGKTSKEIVINKCQLYLVKTSCYCVINAIIETNKVKDIKNLIFTATIIYCVDSTCFDKSSKTSLEYVATTKLRVPLTNISQLNWVQTFYNSTYDIGLIIGLPRISVEKRSNVELPMDLFPFNRNSKIFSLQITIKYDTGIILNGIIPDQPYPYTSYNIDTYDFLEINIDDFQNYQRITQRNLSDYLVLVKLNLKTFENSINLFAWISSVVFDNDRSNLIEFDKPYDSCKVSVSTLEKFFIIPVVEKQFFLLNSMIPNNKPYEIPTNAIKIYYVYDVIAIDMSQSMKCQPFNTSILKCPQSLKSIPKLISNIENHRKSLDWLIQIEKESEKLEITLDLHPPIIFDGQWEIVMKDSVLNKISKWKGPNMRSGTELLLDTNCGSLYQISPISIFRNATLYNQETLETMKVLIDVTSKVELKYLRVLSEYAVISRYGNNLIIQGVNDGNAILELIDEKNRVLSQKSCKVSNREIDIKDLEVYCVSSINTSSNSSNFSHLIHFHDIKFEMKFFNKSQQCLIVIDLIYSDFSRSNILTFPMEQFSIRFYTNMKIIEVSDINSMFYDYEKFNKETSFTIEIQENRGCLNPQVIFKKDINLDPTTHVQTPLPPLLIPEVMNSTSISTSRLGTPTIGKISTQIIQSNESNTNLIMSSSLHKIIYVLCCVLVIVLISIIIKFIINFIMKKKTRRKLFRRRNSCHNDNNNSHEKIPFENNYPPLLPSPGPLIGIADDTNVTLSSPQSFWCLNPNNTLNNKKDKPFIRQFSLPVKGCPLKEQSNIVGPCPPLRWMHKLMPEDTSMNVYSSEETLENLSQANNAVGLPTSWSVNQMEGDRSSGIGSLVTNIDDLLKDPYEAKDRFSRLSELPYMINDKKECVYEPI